MLTFYKNGWQHEALTRPATQLSRLVINQMNIPRLQRRLDADSLVLVSGHERVAT